MGTGMGIPGKGASGMSIGYLPDTRVKILGYRVLGMGIYFSDYTTNSYQFYRICWVLRANFGDSFLQRSKGGFVDLELEIKSFRNRGSSPDLKKYWIFYVKNLRTLG